MSAYTPMKIVGPTTGLVQSREEFILPNDAYPVLENAFVWRERIKRKQAFQLLGRLQRQFTSVSLGNSSASPWTFNILASEGIRGTITNITNFNPGAVTTSEPHNLVTGQKVTITGVGGMTQVNGNTYTVTVTGANTFNINQDTTLFGVYTSGGVWNISNQPNAQVKPFDPNSPSVPVRLVIVVGADTFTDQGNGTLKRQDGNVASTINYQTGVVTLVLLVGPGTPATATFGYFPGLPVMGLRQRDLNSTNNQLTIAFDTVYAYIFSGGAWTEFIPGTTWTGNDSNFFWSTNYWVSAANNRLFWVTNFSGPSGDPIRYTDGVTWTDFAPQIDSTPNFLEQCLCLLPYRSRLIAFNTLEGPTLLTSTAFPQRIRWSAIGSPLTANAWRDDIRGQGGFLDIPTNESIVSVGNVRDNLVIYCSRSTWQLRYTGRSIAPFQLEKVNPELGAEGTFSTVQFDASLVGIGDKGIVECDSYKSVRMDIKIPDLIWSFSDNTEGTESNTGTERIQAVRDFKNRLAFWTFVTQQDYPYTVIYPNRRLVYNYENDSWAIFTDSLTALGTFISSGGRTWADTHIAWRKCNFPWISRQASVPDIIGGNQQGFVFFLDSQVSNDPSLTITAITGGTPPVVITSPNHNLTNDQVVQISGITSSGYATLNGGIYGVTVIDANTFNISTYNATTMEFSDRVYLGSATYNGGGVIAVRDNFWVQSKKFNYIDEGESIQMGYLDLLMIATDKGAITLDIFINYNQGEPINNPPNNTDTSNFFNTTVPTTGPNGVTSGDKYWQRIYCPTRANFLTLVYTLSNAQLAGVEQQSEVQIDAQILWQRKSGRMLISTQ